MKTLELKCQNIFHKPTEIYDLVTDYYTILLSQYILTLIDALGTVVSQLHLLFWHLEQKTVNVLQLSIAFYSLFQRQSCQTQS